MDPPERELAEDEERQAIRRLDRLMQLSEESVGNPEAYPAALRSRPVLEEVADRVLAVVIEHVAYCAG
jgi:hypothetical protein